MRSVAPFLMFQGDGEAALDLYRAVFPGLVVESLERHEAGVKLARLTLAGQTILLNDSPPVHAFAFTPSMSLFVECDTADEVRALAAALGDGGKEMMPPGDYGFGTLFAWVSDRFGVSWQLNCA